MGDIWGICFDWVSLLWLLKLVLNVFFFLGVCGFWKEFGYLFYDDDFVWVFLNIGGFLWKFKLVFFVFKDVSLLFVFDIWGFVEYVVGG